MVCCKKTQLRSERGQEKKDHWPSSNSGPTLLRTCTAVQFTLRYCTFNTLEWAWEEWHLRLPCKMRTCLLCAGIVHKFSNTWLADLLHKALFVYRRTILHVQGYAKTCGQGHVLTAGQLHMWWVILVTTPARNGWIRTFRTASSLQQGKHVNGLYTNGSRPSPLIIVFIVWGSDIPIGRGVISSGPLVTYREGGSSLLNYATSCTIGHHQFIQFPAVV